MLLNANLNENAPDIQDLREVIKRHVTMKKMPDFVTEDFLMRIGIRCLAMGSPNDYVTFTLYSKEAFESSLYQTIVQVSDSTTLAEFYCMAGFNFLAACLKKDMIAWETRSTIRRIKSLLQNSMRFLVFELLDSEHKPPSDTFSGICKLLQMPEMLAKPASELVTSIPFDFCAIPNANRSTNMDIVQVDNLSQLFTILTRRIPIFFVKPFREHLERNFKSIVKCNRVEVKYNPLLALNEYFKYSNMYKQEGHYTIKNDETKQREMDNTINHLCLSNLFTQVICMFIVGLFRVWFGKFLTLELLNSKNVKLSMHNLSEIIFNGLVPPYNLNVKKIFYMY